MGLRIWLLIDIEVRHFCKRYICYIIVFNCYGSLQSNLVFYRKCIRLPSIGGWVSFVTYFDMIMKIIIISSNCCDWVWLSVLSFGLSCHKIRILIRMVSWITSKIPNYILKRVLTFDTYVINSGQTVHLANWPFSSWVKSFGNFQLRCPVTQEIPSQPCHSSSVLGELLKWNLPLWDLVTF